LCRARRRLESFAQPGRDFPLMSIHKSLAIRAALVRSRNVLTRYERILQLRKTGKWKDDDTSPFGLAKVRVLKVKKRGKEKKKKEEGEAAAPGAAAAPAAGGAPAGKAAPGAAAAKAAPAAGKGAPAAKK
jgi:small basic protein (TIGR04137 family)